MRSDLTEDQNMIVETARGFAQDKLRPNSSRWEDEGLDRNVLKELAGLGFAGIYAFFSWVHFCLPSQAACQFNSAWVEFSLLQALPLPGLDKLSETLRGQLFPSSGWISIGVTLAVIAHKTISIAALFLAGLALRNLFKLK